MTKRWQATGLRFTKVEIMEAWEWIGAEHTQVLDRKFATQKVCFQYSSLEYLASPTEKNTRTTHQFF